ncbi:MAG: nucleotidyltransferase domain-containing protein [Candidatus Aminicenantes bacterium]|nr:nucleotidyltransferase domain-containing protein [Candidatus Aminicenantes bacterium]
MNKQVIIDNIKNCLTGRGEILFAYIPGTFLQEGDDFKDIDIALYLDEKKIKKIDTLDYELETSLLLEKEVEPGKSFNRYVPVDVKVINDAPVSFRYSVTNGVLLFSKREDIHEEFLCRTWQEYFDFQYLSGTYLREVLDAQV